MPCDDCNERAAAKPSRVTSPMDDGIAAANAAIGALSNWSLRLQRAMLDQQAMMASVIEQQSKAMARQREEFAATLKATQAQVEELKGHLSPPVASEDRP